MVSAPVFQTSYVSSILTTRFMKIKFKNFWIWLKDQIKRKRFFLLIFLLQEMHGVHFQLIRILINTLINQKLHMVQLSQRKKPQML